jgi:Tol biopolymer transport system component
LQLNGRLIPLTLLAGGAALILATGNGFGAPAGNKARPATLPGSPGQIAFSRNGKRKGIWIADPSGANLRRITRGYDVWPSWSPNGRRIAFMRGRRSLDTDRETKGIYVVNADGSGLRHVLKSPVQASVTRMRKVALPDWSPDGTQLAYQYEDGIGVVNADGTDPRPLLVNPPAHEYDDPAWSPDGTTLALGAVNVEDGISLLNVTGGQPKRVTRSCSGMPSWSPDGRYIACWRISFRIRKGNGIQVVDAATGTVRSLTKGARLDKTPYGPSWTPDGQKIVFGKFRQLKGRKFKSDIYVIDSDGTDQRFLIRNGIGPDWGGQP